MSFGFVEALVQAHFMLDKTFMGATCSVGSAAPRSIRSIRWGWLFRDGVTYLVATLRDYDQVRQLALHRFRDASPMTEKVTPPKGFKLDHYINQGAFDYPLGDFIDLEFTANNFVIQALKAPPSLTARGFVHLMMIG